MGRKLQDQSEQEWLWKGRHVYMLDGTTVQMPDTAANRQAYPKTWNQKDIVGLPLARVAAVFSLSCGVILDLGIAKYAGKGQGEVSLLHKLSGMFSSGDILLADALMCNWRGLFALKQQGVDTVTRLNKATRKADFRRGKQACIATTIDQFQRDAANARSIPADDCDARQSYVVIQAAALPTAS